MKNYVRLFEDTNLDDYSFDALYDAAPQSLKDLLDGLKLVKQNPEWHPEGDTYIHTKTVVNRLAKYKDINLSLAGLFHDEGKNRTTKINPKTGQYHSPGHEIYSAQAVDAFSDWIIEMGGNTNVIREIILNHMIIKYTDQMTKLQRKHIPLLKSYPLILKFSEADRGGTDV